MTDAAPGADLCRWALAVVADAALKRLRDAALPGQEL